MATGESEASMPAAEDRDDDDSLIRAIAAAPAVRITTLTPGTVIAGKYRLTTLLGRGGMGVVWRAIDERLDRAVAVKFQLGAGRESGAAGEVERLRREARALASLSHPHVVTVLEVGIHDGATYVAMELVDGGNARQWLAERPRGWREIVALYREAGAGLGAAHGVGIVHRDFKPDNVLVGTDGRTRVADFGLARPPGPGDPQPTLAELDRTLPIGVDPHGVTLAPDLATRTGALVGTPAYMAPEQLTTSRVDARADQFSFCVALFEALYGERPFKSIASLGDARVVPMPRMRSNATRAPGWVLRVIQRGLARDPDARWSSMAELLERLDRRPARRAWIPAALAVGITVTLVVVGRDEDATQRCAGADDLTTEWNPDRAAAIEGTLRATEARGVDAGWAQLRPRIDAHATSWSQAWQDACAAPDDRAKDERLACLRARRSDLAAVIDVLAHADAATASRLDGIDDRLGDEDACLDPTSSGVAPPTAALAADVAALRDALAGAKAHVSAGHYAYAAALLDPIVARAHELGYRPLFAEVLHFRGLARAGDGRNDGALADFTDSYSIASSERLDAVAFASATLVPAALANLDRGEEALAWCDTARALAERWPEHGKPYVQLLITEGTLRIRRNDVELGTARIREAAEIAATLPDGDLQRAMALEALSDVEANTGRYARAIELAIEAQAGFVAVLGAEHPRAAKQLLKLGGYHVGGDRRVEGRAILEQARERLIAAFGPDHSELVVPLVMLAEVDSNEGDEVAAFAKLEAARALALRQHPRDDDALIRIDDSMAIALSRLGRHAEAILVHRRALEETERTQGPDHPDVRYVLNNLALAVRNSGRSDDAEPWFRRAIAIDDAQGRDDSLSPSLHFNLGFLLLDRGDLDLAAAEFHRARDIGTRAVPPDDAELAWPIMGLGRIELLRGRAADAVVLFDDALARWDVGTDRPAYRELQRDLVLALWSEGRDRPRALELAREALAADPEHDEIAEFLRARAR